MIDEFVVEQERFAVVRRKGLDGEPSSPLSRREAQVVQLLAAGHTNKVIAYELRLAPSTVRVLVHRACSKLGAVKRSELLSRWEAASALPGKGQTGRGVRRAW